MARPGETRSQSIFCPSAHRRCCPSCTLTLLRDRESRLRGGAWPHCRNSAVAFSFEFPLHLPLLAMGERADGGGKECGSARERGATGVRIRSGGKSSLALHPDLNKADAFFFLFFFRFRGCFKTLRVSFMFVLLSFLVLLPPQPLTPLASGIVRIEARWSLLTIYSACCACVCSEGERDLGEGEGRSELTAADCGKGSSQAEQTKRLLEQTTRRHPASRARSRSSRSRWAANHRFGGIGNRNN